MDEFSVTINSAASKHPYPNNTPASFRVALNKPLEFPNGEEWEVGLCELTFPQYWETIKENSEFSLFRETYLDGTNWGRRRKKKMYIVAHFQEGITDRLTK